MWAGPNLVHMHKSKGNNVQGILGAIGQVGKNGGLHDKPPPLVCCEAGVRFAKRALKFICIKISHICTNYRHSAINILVRTSVH